MCDHLLLTCYIHMCDKDVVQRARSWLLCTRACACARSDGWLVGLADLCSCAAMQPMLQDRMHHFDAEVGTCSPFQKKNAAYAAD